VLQPGFEKENPYPLSNRTTEKIRDDALSRKPLAGSENTLDEHRNVLH